MRKKIHQTPLEYATSIVERHGYGHLRDVFEKSLTELAVVHFSAHPYRENKQTIFNRFIHNAFVQYNDHNKIDTIFSTWRTKK